MATSGTTAGVTEGITRGATGDPLVKFISPGVPGGATTPPKGILEQLGSKDFYKGIGQAMKEDFIVPKDGGGTISIEELKNFFSVIITNIITKNRFEQKKL